MITNLPGYGSRSLSNPKPAMVKVEDTQGQDQLVHIPTQGLSVQADYHRAANACTSADAVERHRVEEQMRHTPGTPKTQTYQELM